MTPDLNKSALPRHIAIIMDGNGRWATNRELERIEGHREGARSVHNVVRAAREIGIKALTLYAFSEQNWSRPMDEVQGLMELLLRYIHEERSEIMDNHIRLTTIGNTAQLPDFVRLPLLQLIADSSENKEMELCLALSYGGREDLQQATRRIAREVEAGRVKPDQIDEAMISASLSTQGLPEVDLLIRTSGEQRVSNFLLWELAYAEMLFVPEMWPDFRRPQLLSSIVEYQRRERRFGQTSEQVTQPSGKAVNE